MELTPSALATDLIDQVFGQLPPRPWFGGFHHFVIIASMPPAAGVDIQVDALGILLERLAVDFPDWEIETSGDQLSLELTFTR